MAIPRTAQGEIQSWQDFDEGAVLAMLRVHVFHACRMTVGPEWYAGDVQDGRTRLYYLLDGEASFSFNGNETRLRPGRLYLIPAYGVRSYRCSEQMALYWAHFSVQLHTGPELFESLDHMMGPDVADREQTEQQFHKLSHAFKNDSPTSVVARTGLLLQLIAPFLNAVDALQLEGRQSGMQRFARVFSMIEANLHDVIRISSLATAAGMSPAHFSRSFHDALGITPGRYIMRRRIEEARMRLSRSNDTLDAIAMDLGFCDGSHLSKVFKKETGMPPSSFREMTRHP